MNSISRMSVTLLVLFACPAAASDDIRVRPGDDLAKIVENAPSGATFRFEPGVYRMQFARPKDGQKFIGNTRDGNEVVFNGAVVLSEWARNAGLWFAIGPEKRAGQSGKCRDDAPFCSYSEDLFVDGKRYRRVGSPAEVGRGTFHDDGVRIYLADAPSGKLVEFGSAPFAFASAAEGVSIENIVIEKYAAPAQRGAIDAPQGRDWKLRNVVARWNHGVGARFGSGTHVSGGSFSDNGQLGVGGAGTGIVIENVEIARNNYAGFSPRWESGGLKIVRAERLVIRNACVHNNDGPGLWTDSDVIGAEISGNRVFENRGDGIKHEISYGAKIYGNTVARNGTERQNWLWGSQILIQNSQDVEVYGNVVEIRPEFGNGISVVNQKRGEGKHGAWVARNNSIHDNTIVHLGANGMNGMAADYAADWFYGGSSNDFDRNTYVVPHLKRGYFAFGGKRIGFPALAGHGLERNAKIEVATAPRRPMKLDCARR